MITSVVKVAWDILTTNYTGMAKFNIVKLQNTRRDFESLQMKETKDIDYFMNRLITIVNQLNIYGEEIKDQTVIEKVIGSLSTKFDVVVAAIEEAKDLASLTVDELMGTLLSHEERIDRNKNYTLQIAFKSQVYISRVIGRGRSRRRSRGRSGRYGDQRDGRDRAGEYDSEAFHDYCKQHGIKRQLTTKYTPQQNGVTERKNRTIMNMVRSMLKGRNLSNEYWAEVVACVIYAINRYPTNSVMNRDQNKHGYSEQSKAYKLYNPITKKTIISIDVVFKEQESSNGTIDKTVDAQMPLVEEDDVAEKEQQESQVKTPNKDTPTRTPRFSERHVPSSRSIDRDSPNNQSSDESSNGKRKMRILKDIYNDLDVSSNFALLSFQPSSFEEAIRDENWVQAMDEEIEAIEKNDTWDLVDLPMDKNLIGVNACTRQS
eukprot:PITA_13003